MSKLSTHWDLDGTLLVHFARHPRTPDHIDPRDTNYAGHRTEIVHHGHADHPAVLALIRRDADVGAVVEAIRQACVATQPAAIRTEPEIAVEHTSNGREIRETAAGTFVVQPHNDNYWIECATIEDARDAYQHPDKHRV